MDEWHYQQLRELGLEHEVDDQGTLESNEAHREATSIASRIVLCPTVVVSAGPAILILIQFVALPSVMLILLMLLVITTSLVAVFAARVCGWLAHRLFWGSSIPVRRMAIAFALIYDMTLFGWILVVLLT